MPTIRPAVKAAVIGCFWIFFSGAYFLRLPIPGFWSHLADVIWALLVFVAASGMGFLVTRGFLAKRLSPLETLVLSAGAGFGSLSLFVFALGLFQAWTPVVARLSIVLLSVSGAYALRELLLRVRQQKLQAEPEDPQNRWPIVLLIVGAALGAVLAFAPITYYDSLVYHLALPSAYVKAGRWIPETQLIYSAFPQNLEMLWTLGMLLRSDVVSNLIGFSLALLLILAVIAFGRRFFDQSVGLLGGGLLAVMPAFLLLSSGGYVDVGLALFGFLSFYVIMLWTEDPRPGYLYFAGALAGITVGIKYTGGIAAVMGLVFILWESRQRGVLRMVTDTLRYGALAFLAFLPWMVKNILYVGNPVFPFLYGWGLKAMNPWIHDAAEGYFRGLTEYESRQPWQLVRLIWDLAVSGQDFGGGMDALGDFGWAALIGLLPCLWLCRRLTPATRRLIVYALLFFIPWGMSRPVLRFLMPLAPFLALLAAEGWAQGMRLQPLEIRWPARALLASLLASGLLLFFFINNLTGAYQVPLGLQSRDEFLRKRLTYYGAADFLNRLPQTNVKIFVLGDQRGYYYAKPVVITPVFNVNPLVLWANEVASPEALVARLRQEHFTHLVVNYAEMERLANYKIFGFTPQGLKNWNGLQQRLAQRLYKDPTSEVLAL